MAFPSQLNKLKLLWSLLKVNWRIPVLIWRGIAYFVQNNTSIILPGNTQTNYKRIRAGRPIFGAKLEAWRQKLFHIFHFLQSDMAFEIENPFS